METMGQNPTHEQHLEVSGAKYNCMNGHYVPQYGFPAGRYGYCRESGDTFYIEYRYKKPFICPADGWYLYGRGQYSYACYYNPSDSMTVPLTGWYCRPLGSSEQYPCGLTIKIDG